MIKVEESLRNQKGLVWQTITIHFVEEGKKDRREEVWTWEVRRDTQRAATFACPFMQRDVCESARVSRFVTQQ